MVEGTLFAVRYRIVRRLGAGAMGAVYEVVDLSTERRRALKVMHPHALTRAHLRERFRAEATITGRVRSPFLIDVLDAGVDEATDTPFLVMELLRGEDLGRKLAREGRLSAAEVIALLSDVARGLDAIHRLGVVHRDLKPSNLFVEAREHEPPRIKILDFGVAKLVEEIGARDSTAAAGTPLYMAPEQFRGRGVTPAADIHALGMIAFTLLVGAPYWDEEREENPAPLAFALAVSKGPSERATARAARHDVTLPAAFDAWFERAAAPDPSARFPGAKAAVRALAEALGEHARDLEAANDEAEPTEQTEERLSATSTKTAATGEERVAETRSLGTESNAPLGTISLSVNPAPRAAHRALEGSSAAPTTQQAAAENGTTQPWARAALAVGLLAALGIGVSRRVQPAASPLAPATSILACPILEASGVEEPAGWLGAAAAATICERTRILLGGTTARTLVPAELLALPSRPVDHYPIDPFGEPDARRRSIEAARRRAAAYFDGSVVRNPSGFRVELILRRADGTEMGRATGASRALYQAVRSAMDPLVSPSLVPRSAALDPVIAEWSGARDGDGALALVDLTLALAHNAGTLDDECKRLDAHAAGMTDLMRIGMRWQCAYALGLPIPKVDLPAPDPTSTAARITRARLRHIIAHVDEPEAIAEIQRLEPEEKSPWARSTVASTGSCLLQSTNIERASELSFRAIQAEPKNPTGEFCAPWGQLLAMSVETPSAASVLHAMQAWTPWDGNAWIYQTSLPGDATTALAYARRAYVLTPSDAYVAGIFTDRLLAAGAREEARGVGLSLLGGNLPVERVEGALVLVRVEASEARFAAALARARRAMAITPEDVGWVRVQRLEIAWRAVEIAHVLGHAAEVADFAVERFLDPDPPPLDGANITGPMRIPAICARASAPVARRCFARFRSLRERLAGGIIPETAAFAEGAERWVLGDFPGAARAFRPLLRNPGMFAALLPDVMEATFERTGETELVERLEAAALEGGAELHGASPAMARAARRAAAKGERERARSLAKKVIDAWSVADETVPAVEEMRRLLAELR
ncbi:Putative serine/threonine-protein kinase pknH [Minicystis rosea]|nr:Putative serine/threonine-protein kinase pknH [Minicystis rosea]